MANTESQAEAIRDLMVERLELFDSSLDTSEGSPLWSQVIQPVFEALGTDPFDTDVKAFLQDRVRQAFPALSAEDGDMLVDLLVTPLEVLLEPFKREEQILRRGQSARNADTMRLEDARDLAANFFTAWRSGSRASGVVRVYYSNPTYVNILPTISFETSDGLRFFPTTSVIVRPETMLLQRSGTEYYVDVPVIAEDSGSSYGVAKGTITTVTGLTGYSRITNLTAFEPGGDPETVAELLARTQTSLTERSLVVRRGIVARINQDFRTIVDVEAVGYGDPEMERDVMTGGGEGTVAATGVCFVVGQFVLMFSMFERRGEEGTSQIAEGDEVEFNYWSFLYDVDPGEANETFTIDTILFDSRDSITEMPSILLFRIDGAPSVAAPVAGTLPGVLPGVFCVVRTTGVLEISDIPGGILNPDTARGTIEIEDGEVHIGGHYDVWMRPSSTSNTSADLSSIRSETSHLEADDLVISGESASYAHLVHRKYALTFTPASGSLQLGETVTGGSSGAVGVIGAISSTEIELWEMEGVEFQAETITGSVSGATASVTAVDSYDWYDDGAVEAGMALAIVSGNDVGMYRILKVEGPFLYLDVSLTTTAKGQYFRVLSELSVDVFDPKAVLVPFGDAEGNDLNTVIGSSTLRTTINLQDYGVIVGDVIEILEGDDKGVYPIQKFDADLGGTAPVVATAMTATNSNLSYKAYRTTTALQRPLVRVSPGGVAMLDPSGQDSGYTIPYALPVDARAKAAFSGSKAVAAGSNGFVLMDPGDGWAPTADYAVDIAAFDWTSWTGSDFEDFYTDGDFKRCYTDECLDAEGYIAVVSIYDDGSMFLDSNLPSATQTFLQDMKDWFLGVIASFNFGGDEEELINGFSPFKFGPNTDTALTLLLQFEIVLPYEIFDGCNNVFVAIPEFDWESEFEDADNFEEAIGRYNDGDMTGPDPALLQARSGDVLTVLVGPNAGSYIIERVHQYYLVTSGALSEGSVDLTSQGAYKVAVAVIRDEFPVPALQGLVDFFAVGGPTWSVPSAPDLPFEVFDEFGASVDGWDWVSTSLTWFFQWMDSLGFDLPESVELDVQGTLQAFWELLFSSYIVGRPTAAQYIRCYFLEPTSVTMYAPQVCARYEWAPPVHSGGSVQGDDFTLPMADLEDVTVSLTVRRLTGDTVLSATIDAATAALSDVSDFADALQELLDPDQDYVTITGPSGEVTGSLTIAGVRGGVDEWIYVDALDGDDGFRWLGFYESEGGKGAVISSNGPSSGVAYELIDPTPGQSVSLSVEITTSDLYHLTGTATAGSIGFQIGEEIEGLSSGETGTLWAIAHDTDGVQAPHFWLTNTSGTFTATETIRGNTSLDTNTLTAEDSSPTMEDNDIGDYEPTFTFEELAVALETKISEAVVKILRDGLGGYDDERQSSTLSVGMEWVDNGDSSGQFEITIYDTGYTSAIEEWRVDNSTDPSDIQLVETYMAITTSRPLVSSVGVVTGDDYTPSATSPTIDVDVDGSDEADVDFGLDYFSALDFKTDVQDLIDASDFDGAAQALNANSDFYADTTSGERAVLWIGGDSYIYLKSMAGGTDASMTTTDLSLLGFTDTTTAGTSPDTNGIVQGSTAPNTTETTYHGHKEPTLFVAAAGAAELLFTPSDEADPFQVFPGQDEDGDIPATELPRDLQVGSAYDDQITTELAFTDSSYGSPMELGVQEGSDFVHIYEQRRFLEHTVEASDTEISRDRVVAVFTEFGSNEVTLPEFTSEEFNFLAPNSGLLDDEVQVGDVIFIEEGDDEGGYTVVDRSARSLTLDRALTESTGRVYRYSNDGVIEPDPSDALFTSDDASFTEDDIGRYLTIWACNREEYDGSYEITAVESDGSGCTLDADVFEFTETDIHWAVVKAPVEDPSSSGIDGRTALVGLRPIRVYNGTPSEWRVVRVTPDLARTDSRVYVAHGDEEEGPKAAVEQPYRIVRPGAQHLSSTAMAEQREKGLYYFDVLAQSLGGDDVYNIPKSTKMEPVFGTYDSDGYRLETEDNRLTFSSMEETSMVLSPTFLPAGFDDLPTNLVNIEGKSLRVTYDYAPTVSQVQRMMTSETDRVLCANVLARHFLPSYVSLDVNYTGGNKASKIAGDIRTFINGLSAVEEIDVSVLEKILHANSVVRYDHPMEILLVTHDLDRRLVGSRTENRISDDDIEFNGTNRTTFFIAGPDRSAEEDEADIDDGERIYLSRSVASTAVR